MTSVAPEILGLHHVKVAVSDLRRSRIWCEQLLAVRPAVEFRDDDGTVRGVAYQPLGAFTLALREHAEVASATAGFDPFAILVADRAAIDAWVERFDALSLPHAPVQRGAQGWKVVAADPDGTEVAFYSATPADQDPAPDPPAPALDLHDVRPDNETSPHAPRPCRHHCSPWCSSGAGADLTASACPPTTVPPVH